MIAFAVRLMAGVLGATLAFPQTAPPESAVVGVGPFLHIISDLDQSLAFYHGTLGLELTGPSGEHKFKNNPAVANLYGRGEARTPEHKRIADPGAVTLILRVTKAGASPEATLHNPDGFSVEVERSALYTSMLGFKTDGDWLAVPGASVRIRLTSSAAPRCCAQEGAAFLGPVLGKERSILRYQIIVRDPNNFYLQPMEAR